MYYITYVLEAWHTSVYWTYFTIKGRVHAVEGEIIAIMSVTSGL